VNVIKQRSPHAGRLERYLGTQAEVISRSMRGWYADPISVANVPGGLLAHADGDFSGMPDVGAFTSLLDRFDRFLRNLSHHSSSKLYAGFGTFDALIAAATSANERQEFAFAKTGITGVAGVTSSLWGAAGQPGVGAAAGAAPTGTNFTDATVGGMPFTNPTSPKTQHLVNGMVIPSAINTLLLYDRIFGVTKTMNSTATEAVTGVPIRYQNPTGADAARGNFLFVEVRTALPATAHNWVTVNYTTPAGGAGVLPSLPGVASAIASRLDHAGWFAPLASGDVGLRGLTQIQCSALVASGAVDFVVGHPLAWFPLGIANIGIPFDGVNAFVNLARIFDDACLAFLEVSKPVTTATTYSGTFLGLSA
jgi:hypothetical protein